MNKMFTRKGYVAIEQPIFTKIEAEMQGGIARIAQRVHLIEQKVVLGYDSETLKLSAGDNVILKADAGLQTWAKTVHTLGDKTFVLVPEDQILGYTVVK